MPLHYRDKIAIEQLRSIEQHSQALTIRAQPASSFDEFLHNRIEQGRLQPSFLNSLAQAQRWYRTTVISCCLLACLVGVIAVLKALIGPDTLNVFWVLIVLLGFNLLSFVLWLVFTTFIRAPARSPLASVILQLLHWFIKLAAKDSPARFSSKTWLSIQLSEPQGKWFIGGIVHSIWLCYLIGGFVALLLALMTRQYDFIWGSTLLSEVSFEQLTAALSLPMTWIHWPTPSIDEVAASQLGLNNVSATLRSSWAYFLLGCLLFYGLIPRLIALLACYGIRLYQLQRYTLDYDDAYYLKLKRQWQPMSTTGNILDPDTVMQDRKTGSLTDKAFQALPRNALWIGVEMSRHTLEKNFPLKLNINVVDKNSTAMASELIKKNQLAVVFVLNAQKPPDRGMQRLLKSMMLPGREFWLLCHGWSDNNVDIFGLWQEQAQVLNIPSDHCVLMNNMEEGKDG